MPDLDFLGDVPFTEGRSEPAANWRRLEQFAESLTDLTSRGRSQPGLLPRANLPFEVSRPENPPKNVPVRPV
jgi:hypothetical protein